jgi:hypothetical protein
MQSTRATPTQADLLGLDGGNQIGYRRHASFRLVMAMAMATAMAMAAAKGQRKAPSASQQYSRASLGPRPKRGTMSIPPQPLGRTSQALAAPRISYYSFSFSAITTQCFGTCGAAGPWPHAAPPHAPPMRR